MMVFRKLSVISLLVLALVSSSFSPALAQNNLQIDQLLVEIWPEFDQPQMLVIYRLSLPETTSLPADMSLRIPKSSGGPYTLAIQGTDGGLYNLDFTTEDEGDWIKVSFSTPSLLVHLEFYDSNCDLETINRSYTYIWPGDYQVNNLSFHIQQPPTASDMQVSPAPTNKAVENDGLTYHSASLGLIESGKITPIEISYIKNNDSLTYSPQVVEPAEPISVETEGRITTRQLIPWILGAVGITLIAAGAFWYFRGAQIKVPENKQKKKSQKTIGNASEGKTHSGDGVYCHNCGRRSNKGDVFCRACGTKFRSDCD